MILLMSLLNTFWLEIELQAIINNVELIKSKLPPEIETVINLQHNLFGLGIRELKKLIETSGVSLNLRDISRAIELRQFGVSENIYLSGLLELDDLNCVSRYSIIPYISIEEKAQLLSYASQIKSINSFLQVEIGPETSYGSETFHLCDAINRMASLSIVGINFDCLNKEDDANHLQTISDILRTIKIDPKSLNKRCPLEIFLMSHHLDEFNSVVVDEIIYGISGNELSFPGLSSCFTLKSRVVDITTTQNAGKVTKKATIPVGLYHGMNYRLSNKGEVLIKGKRARMLGMIDTLSCQIDISNIDEDTLSGEEVVIVGKQNNDRITIQEIAEKAGTIASEVLFGFSDKAQIFYI